LKILENGDNVDISESKDLMKRTSCSGFEGLE
jgi:hypothetical protein